MLVMTTKQKWNNSIFVLWEGQLVVDEGRGGQEIIDEDWACIWTEFHNRSKLSSLVPNSNGGNECMWGRCHLRIDLIQDIVQAKEMA